MKLPCAFETLTCSLSWTVDSRCLYGESRILVLMIRTSSVGDEASEKCLTGPLLSLLTPSSGKKANCPALYSGNPFSFFANLKVLMSVPSSSSFLVKVNSEYEPDCLLASLEVVVVVLLSSCIVSSDFGSGLTIISPLASSTLTEYD